MEFCRNPNYESPAWPEDYWPDSPGPEGKEQWNEMVKAFHRDFQDMVELIKEPKHDLLVPLAHGSGQTLFREAMLIVDHNAYHIGQIVQVRRLLGIWK